MYSLRCSSVPLFPAVLGLVLLLASPERALATMPPLSGVAPPGLIQASHDGLFALDPVPTGLRTQVTAGTWRLPVILVSFADDTLNYTAGAFNRLLFDTTHVMPNGSASEYWRWVSGGRVRLTGRVVATVKLDQPQSYYANNNYGVTGTATPRNDLGFARDVLQKCQGSVNWNEFDLNLDGYVDMIWFVHAGVGGEGGDRNRLWSLTTHMTGGWGGAAPFPTTTLVPGSLTRQVLCDRFTMLPEKSLFHADSLSEIGVFAHEFGHTLGLPDLYSVDNPRNTGPGNWSLMSSGAYGGDGESPDLPTHLGAWPIRFLGWDRTVHPSRDTTFALAPLERTAQLIDFWSQGEDSPEHFLIENRRRIDYDRKLPGEGLIVYRVNETVIGFGIENNRINSDFDRPGLMVVEGDDDFDLWVGRNRGDGNDPLPGALDLTSINDDTHPSTRTYAGLRVNIALDNIAFQGDSTRVHLQVRPPGWQPPEDWTGDAFNPIPSRTAARASGHDAAGTEYVVLSEYVGGRAQVRLRSSLAWDQPLSLSQTTAAALSPALAILPDGDLATVWSDTRHGRAEIYYRARIRDVWTPERVLVSLPGTCRSPSLAADGRGGLYLAFQYQNADTTRLMFERFTYASTIGQPMTVVGTPIKPENPTVLASSDGTGYLLWQDRRPGGRLWFARFHPDSGVQAIQELSFESGGNTSYAAALDSTGTLTVIWNLTGPNVNQLLIQTRGGLNGPVPIDGVFESLSVPLELLTLDVDGERSIHVCYGLAGPNGVALRYRRKWPDGSWDAVGTDLSFPNNLIGSQPLVLPRRDGNVDIAYTGLRNQQPRFMIRRRVLHPESQLAAGPGREPAAVPGLWLAPNPVRAGTAIMAGADIPPGAREAIVDLFDLGGRRVATLPLTATGSRWSARLSGAETRAWTGIYFARVRGASRSARVVVVR